MPWRMRRCTGFSPSRTSGSARLRDRRQRVGEVALFQRLAEVDRLDRAAGRGNQVFAHGTGLAPNPSRHNAGGAVVKLSGYRHRSVRPPRAAWGDTGGWA